VLRVRHYARSTEESYVQWIIRFIHFHHKRHPREMGGRRGGKVPHPPGRARAGVGKHAKSGLPCAFVPVVKAAKALAGDGEGVRPDTVLCGVR
jgi:hypothetical protein